MKKYIYLGLLAIFSYAGFVVAQLPADKAYVYAREKGLLPVELFQVNGSAWSGKAGVLKIGQKRIQSVDWQLDFASLLMGEIKLALGHELAGNHVSLITGRSITGDYSLSSGDEPLSLAELEKLLNPQPYGLKGNAVIGLEKIRIDGGQLVGLEGHLEWHDAGLGAPLNITVGSFSAEFETQDDGIHGDLKDISGALKLKGDFILKPDGNYTLKATLKSRDPNRKDLKQALRMFGTPSPDGQVSLSRTGKLNLQQLLSI